MTDQTRALRDRIAEAIHADLTSTAYRRDGGLLGIVPRLADAVLAVLPEPTDRGAVLREAADDLVTEYGVSNRAAAYLRRKADEDEAQGIDPVPGRGECPVCGREYKLTSEGRLPRHAAHVPTHRSADGIYCRGAGELRRLGGEPTPAEPSLCGESVAHIAGYEPEAGETPADTEAPAELLALATVLEIPRVGSAVPLQLRRSWGHTDRWAICDREGRRWHREYGWVYEPDGIRDEAQRDDTRYTLAEAVPLARKLAAEARSTTRPEAPEQCPPGCIACATDESHDPAPTAGVRQDGAQTQEAADDTGDVCGAEPPATDTWGDCWCTRPPGHTGEHQCQPCTGRHGAPGWTDESTIGAQEGGDK